MPQTSSQQQITNKSDCPHDNHLLFSKEELLPDFGSFSETNISQTDVVVNEGPFHQENASVIKVLDVK